MRNVVLFPNGNNQAENLNDIDSSLQRIGTFMLDELTRKQTVIDSKNQEISALKSLITEKDTLIDELNNKLSQLQHNIEGNRQLNIKLLDDLSRMQLDIDWYKRTYETRSLMGTIWEKVFGRRK